MKKANVLMALTLALAGCGGGSGDATPRSTIPLTTMATGYNQVVWEENFANSASGAPNATRWAMLTGNGTEYGNPGWGNNELEYYLPANVTVGGGLLQIRGKADATVAGHTCSGAPCAFSSSRVTSLQTVDLSKPGLLEIKAQLPTSAGSWPAIWLLPGNTPGQTFPPTQAQLTGQPTWPAGGEIDMAEWLGQYFTGDAGSVQSTLHLPAGASAPYADNYIYKKVSNLASLSSNFHIYQLQWTADQIAFNVDNQAIMTCFKANLQCTPSDGAAGVPLSHWPFGSSYVNYYLILNLAIGGNLGGTPPSNYDQTMNVAYVRYMTF
jgi:beta-glucanase (GH16 family)